MLRNVPLFADHFRGGGIEIADEYDGTNDVFISFRSVAALTGCVQMRKRDFPNSQEVYGVSAQSDSPMLKSSKVNATSFASTRAFLLLCVNSPSPLRSRSFPFAFLLLC